MLIKNSERACSQDSWILIRPLHFLAAASAPVLVALRGAIGRASCDDKPSLVFFETDWCSIPTSARGDGELWPMKHSSSFQPVCTLTWSHVVSRSANTEPLAWTAFHYMDLHVPGFTLSLRITCTSPILQTSPMTLLTDFTLLLPTNIIFCSHLFLLLN